MKSTISFLFVIFLVVSTVGVNAQVKNVRRTQGQAPATGTINPGSLPVLKIEFENKALLPGKGMVFYHNNQQYTIGIKDEINLVAEEGIEITGKYPNLKIGLKKHKVGDKYKDGTIFYVDETGQHGLILCTYEFNTTWATFEWEMHNKTIDNGEFKDLNTYSSGIGAGRYNTMCMMLADDLNVNVMDPGEPYSVLYYLKHNKNDWYIPSYDELKLIYDNRAMLGIRLDSENRIVWSSTEGEYIFQGRSDGPRGQDMPGGWNFEGYNGIEVKLTSHAGKARNGVKCIDFYTGKTVNIAKTYGNTVMFVKQF